MIVHTFVTVDAIVVGIANAFGTTVGSHREQTVLGALQKARHATLGHVQIDAFAFVAFGALIHFVAEWTIQIAYPLTLSGRLVAYLHARLVARLQIVLVGSNRFVRYGYGLGFARRLVHILLG